MADNGAKIGKPGGPHLILGSASPRRAALLASLDIRFVVRTVAIDEPAMVERTDIDPGSVVERIAVAKFAAFAAQPDDGNVLLTADTLVACDGVILGKPETPDHLQAMLQAMSGRELMIATAVCVGKPGHSPQTEVVTTRVVLRLIESHEIHTYVATGVGMDKAGGLALQAEARPFIDRLEGCWTNVLGLPLCAVSRLLGARQVSCSIELCGAHNG